LKETGHQLGGLSIGDAPWIDAIMIPTADRNRGIDLCQSCSVVYWDVFGLLGSRSGDDANRGTFQPRCDSRTHPGTERLVHFEVSEAPIRQVDFVVAHCAIRAFRFVEEVILPPVMWRRARRTTMGADQGPS